MFRKQIESDAAIQLGDWSNLYWTGQVEVHLVYIQHLRPGAGTGNKEETLTKTDCWPKVRAWTDA